MSVFSVQTIVPVPGLSNLQTLSGAPGDIAIAAGYWSPGDGGGGSFHLEAPNDAATIASVAQVQALINTISLVASPVVVIAAGHPFATGQAVVLSGTIIDGTWIITRLDANRFWLNGSAGDTVTIAPGGAAHSVIVTTRAPHGRAVGQRLAVAGARWSDGTLGINGQWDNLGVTGATMLTLGAQLSGSYLSGGLCGDNGFTVPIDAAVGRWVRIEQSPSNPMYFGARGDSTTDGDDGADDAPAFAAAIAAMPAGGPLSIPPPRKTWYRLASDLAPDRPVRITGPGKNVPCLSFGQGRGIRLRNSLETSTGHGTNSSALSDLLIKGTFVSIPEWTPTSYAVGARVRSTLANPANAGVDSGVHYRCVQATAGGSRPEPAWNNLRHGATHDGGGTWIAEDWSTITIGDGLITIERCRIQPSTDNAIYLLGMSSLAPRTNVNNATIRSCFLYQGDAHGIFIRGDDANRCVIEANTVQAFQRGAGIYDASQFGNVHISNVVELTRLSYFGPTSAHSVWLGNYHEADTGAFRISTKHLWLSGNAAPDVGFTNATGNPPTIFDGESWNKLKVLGIGDGVPFTQVLGSSPQVLSEVSRPDRSGTIERYIGSDADDPGGYFSRRNAVDTTNDPYDGAEEWTAEGSVYLPYRRRFRQGFYLGAASQGLQPIWVTSSFHPPGPDTLDLVICGRLLWEKGSIVFNRSGTDPAPGWLATRRGGWGGGRHGYRHWTAGASTIVIGEGIEPSPPNANGKVFRLLRVEIRVGGAWQRADDWQATLGAVEPAWNPEDRSVTQELLVGGDRRLIWECWGSVGMTWAALPAPAATIVIP